METVETREVRHKPEENLEQQGTSTGRQQVATTPEMLAPGRTARTPIRQASGNGGLDRSIRRWPVLAGAGGEPSASGGVSQE